ncbi:DUF475 domain-containing protein [Commensalibacter sp. Nvir]|uniref:DUF475 domain-containing protein n=1 Tax=Commensalibacter sp. Nvir TaxID=3069817 RepID=UPI0030C850CA
MHYFKSSFYFTALCLSIAGYLGYQSTHTLAGTLSTIFICAMLGVLEISISFDNAVVNANTLKTMSKIWQRRFLTWGMIIAVFGIRLIFPLLIVSIAARVGPISALQLALNEPERYAQIVSNAHTAIMGFGAAFLALVGLNFFFNTQKNVHWIRFLEVKLVKLSKLDSIEIMLVLIAIIFMSKLTAKSESLVFVISGLFGIVTYISLDALNHLLNQTNSSHNTLIKAGLGSFLYLEVLDASFSFDGVIAAFALTTNLFIIVLGLSIGAMFVRSLTLMLVNLNTLNKYRFLEHGAFWAILVLSGFMFFSVYKKIPEVITGLIGAILIVIAFISSLYWNKKYSKKV